MTGPPPSKEVSSMANKRVKITLDGLCGGEAERLFQELHNEVMKDMDHPLTNLEKGSWGINLAIGIKPLDGNKNVIVYSITGASKVPAKRAKTCIGEVNKEGQVEIVEPEQQEMDFGENEKDLPEEMLHGEPAPAEDYNPVTGEVIEKTENMLPFRKRKED